MEKQKPKPRVMEIRVRMDCNGCVQKIKKALHGITGISDLYIDFPQQKVSIIGSVDPSHIVKAIKKTRKSVVVCVHTQPSDEEAQLEAEPQSKDGVKKEGAPPPPPPAEQPPVEAAPPVAGQTEDDKEEEEEEEAPPSQPESTPLSEPNSSPKSANETSQSTHHSNPQNLEEIHVVHHHLPDYGQPPQPIHVSHSYSTYKASPYVTEYAFPRQQPPPENSRYGMPEHYTSQEVYYSGNNGSTYFGSQQIRGEPSQPPQPIHHYSIHDSNGRQGNANLRGEPSQLPQPIHHYSIHNSNGRQWDVNPRGEPSQPPPPPVHHYSGRQCNTHLGGPQIRGEEHQSPHPIHYYSGYSSSGHWNANPSSPQIRGEPYQPTTHSYNTYKPAAYATEYAYLQSPQGNSHYNTPDSYNQVYYSGNNGNGNGSGNITSLFSDENPNACSIV